MKPHPDTILLSIHPCHVNNILKGRKRFELRKKIPLHIKQVVIYATAPESRIVGICQVEEILSDKPESLWKKVRGASCVDASFYNAYFKTAQKAFAVKLGRMQLISRRITLSHPRIRKTPPQSFVYLDNDQVAWLADCVDKMISGGTKKVFIGGVHGSGKSFYSQNVVSSYGYTCVSASQIIEDGHGGVNADKCVGRISDNQKILIDGLRKYQAECSHLAIDGHFCVLNEKGMLEKIPFEVFEEINPEIILLAKPSVSVIRKRLCQRKGKTVLEKRLASFQEQEFQYATEIAARLEIPLEVIDTNLKVEELMPQFAAILEKTNYPDISLVRENV